MFGYGCSYCFNCCFSNLRFVNFRKLIVDDIELFLNFLRNDVLLECYCGLEYFKKIVSRSKVFFKLGRLY